MNKKLKKKQQTNLKQLNFKVQPDFYWKLKNFASAKRLKMAEMLEKAFKFYEQKEKMNKEIDTYKQSIQAIEKQMQVFQGNISWSWLEAKVNNNLSPEFFNKIGLVITYEVLKETLEQFLIAGKRLGLDKRI